MKKIPTPILDKIARKLGHPNFEDMTRHHLNPVHIYAKLIDLGVDEKQAREFAEFYEKLYYNKTHKKISKRKMGSSLYTKTMPIHIVSFIYVGLMAIITFVFKQNIPLWQNYLIVYLGYAAFVIIITRVVKGFSNPVLEFIAIMYPWFSVPNFYELLRHYIHAVFPYLFDPFIHQFELALFGIHPTVYLQRFATPLLTEIMSFGYFSYYLIFLFPPFIFYFFRRQGAASLIFGMSLAYYFCFILFVLIPVAGPRFTLADKYSVPLIGYFLPEIQARMMAKFALRGAAFPSSHVAMVMASSFIVKRYMPWLFKIIFPLSIMVALGAVYGRYHYVTDVVAGGIVGIVSALITYKVYQENI